MTIKAELNQILALVNAQTNAISSLAQAVAAIPTQPGQVTVDNTTVLAALQPLQAAVADIQSQLETGDTPTPAPSNDGAA